MSYVIPDPRFEMPALFEPGVKSFGNVIIDNDHEYAYDLRLALINQPSEPKNRVNDLARQSHTKSSVGVTRTAAGELKFNSTGDEIQISRAGHLEPGKITVITSVTVVNSFSGSYQCVLTKDKDTWSSPYYSYHLRIRSGTKARFSFQVNNGSTNAGTDTSEVISYNQKYWLAMTYDGTTVKGFVLDANLTTVATASVVSAGSITYYPTDLHLGDTAASVLRGLQGGSKLHSAYIWGHAKNETSIKRFLKNEYQFLIPA